MNEGTEAGKAAWEWENARDRPCDLSRALDLFIERRIGKVDVVFLRRTVLYQPQAFAEVSNLSKWPPAVEPQGIRELAYEETCGKASSSHSKAVDRSKKRWYSFTRKWREK